MNNIQIIRELNSRYPGKGIFKNDENNPTEIICEVEPASLHPEYSVAIAFVDKSLPHQHRKTIETYKVIKGKLILHVGDKTIILNKGESYEISLNSIHWAEGDETWVECKSYPGWTPEDHILA